MNFTLTQNEAQFLLSVMGELPTRMGALPLLQNFEKQFRDQMPKSEPETDTQTPA